MDQQDEHIEANAFIYLFTNSQQIRILHKTNYKNIFSELLSFWNVNLLYM